MIVKFATTCDAPGCGQRSPEYTEWPACTECDRHCCPRHQEPGTLKDSDGEFPDWCTCTACAADSKRLQAAIALDDAYARAGADLGVLEDEGSLDYFDRYIAGDK